MPQDCLYTVETLGETTHYRVMGTLRKVITASEKPDAVVAAIANDNVHVITLTVTEKGYSLTADGTLDTRHPEILNDLESPAVPQSTIGWLFQGLAARYRSGRQPISILSCDNIAFNTRKLRAALLDFGREVDRDVTTWIADGVGFPNTVVDCLVPKTERSAYARSQAAAGVIDEAVVQREEFSQWVIEDDFAGPRPVWETAGAQIVGDVEPFAKLKLHVLNATHSALAYLAPPRGHAYVRGAIHDTDLMTFLDKMVAEEIAPALAPLPVADYWARTKRRFANPSLNHALAQIAEDGSVKLTQRIFPLLIANSRADRPVRGLARVIRAWLEFARQPVKDPLSDRLQAWSKCGGRIEVALDDPMLFPEPFRTDLKLRTAVVGDQ